MIIPPKVASHVTVTVHWVDGTSEIYPVAAGRVTEDGVKHTTNYDIIERPYKTLHVTEHAITWREITEESFM